MGRVVVVVGFVYRNYYPGCDFLLNLQVKAKLEPTNFCRQIKTFSVDFHLYLSLEMTSTFVTVKVRQISGKWAKQWLTHLV